MTFHLRLKWVFKIKRYELGAIVKQEMQRLFRMSDLGLLSYYLGIEVRQSKAIITLGQAAYAQMLL